MHEEYKKFNTREEYERAILQISESESGKLIFSKLYNEFLYKNTFKTILNGLESDNPNYNIDGIIAGQKMAYDEGKSSFIIDVIQILNKHNKIIKL